MSSGHQPVRDRRARGNTKVARYGERRRGEKERNPPPRALRQGPGDLDRRPVQGDGAPRRSAHATAEAESEERTEARSSRKERTRRRRDPGPFPGPCPPRRVPPRGEAVREDRASSSRPSMPRLPRTGYREGAGMRNGLPVPTASNTDSATRRNRSAIGGERPPAAVRGGTLHVPRSSRAAEGYGHAEEDGGGLLDPCASSTPRRRRGEHLPNRPSSPPRRGEPLAQGEVREEQWWFTTTRSASAPAAGRREMARSYRRTSTRRTLAACVHSPQTRASSGPRALGSPRPVVSANACTRRSSGLPGELEERFGAEPLPAAQAEVVAAAFEDGARKGY